MKNKIYIVYYRSKIGAWGIRYAVKTTSANKAILETFVDISFTTRRDHYKPKVYTITDEEFNDLTIRPIKENLYFVK